jgi:hypothetical protein
MPLPFPFDFKNPDYVSVFEWRLERLDRLREDEEAVDALKLFYKNDPAQFIIDWGMTYDPRNPDVDLPAAIPFMLFPKQEDWVNWFLDCWKNRKNGITEKSRESGITWLTISTAVTICLFNEGITAGFGSRTEDDVDSKGNPSSIFGKARQFINLLPDIFLDGWNEKRNTSHMKIEFPATESFIFGDAGDNMGRGGRSSFYFVDESAFIPRPHLVDAALSENTRCRQDISTPRGMANTFAMRRFSGKIPVFTFHWRDDPRKDDEWYQNRCNQIIDKVIIAQELDLDYSASLEGIVIPAQWVRASVDAHLALGLNPSGERTAGLDVADGGKDLNALCGRYGFLVEHIESWSGKGSDVYESVEKSFFICDTREYHKVYYDADGLGAPVKGDARIINEKRAHKIEFVTFRGSAEVVDPDREMVVGRKNKDFFENLKAQAWWDLRTRFRNTYRAVAENQPYDPSYIISISSQSNEYQKLCTELSQPTFCQSKSGKVMIDKTPEGMASPNLADAVMIAFAPRKRRGLFYV